MKKILQRGFTLIELLVVIAIIGILAAVVLASLNDARQSGSDAAIQQSLGNARAQAEIVYNRNGVFSYATVCADDQVIQLRDAADDANGGASGVGTAVGNVFCNSDADNWVLAATLTGTTTAWCVDSTGAAGRVAGVPSGTDLACN